MGRQYRSLPQNEGEALIVPRATGSALIQIANYGVTVLSDSTSPTSVLDAPVAGVEKTIFCTAAAGTATVVRGSTGQTVSFNSTGGGTIITFQATVDKCITLVGVNSTQWLIKSYKGAAFTTVINLTTT